VYRGKILSLDKHVHKSAKALGFGGEIHTAAQVQEAVFRMLAANGMRDGAHMRLTLSRGEKNTSSMNPGFNVYGTTLIVLAEWKARKEKQPTTMSRAIPHFGLATAQFTQYRRFQDSLQQFDQ
jgi:hypothetical protein